MPKTAKGMAEVPVRKKLTFDMDPERHRKFKAWCATRGTTMVHWLNQQIDEQLDEARTS